MKFYVTTPIYYVNDKPHIGSAYTTIAADVLARYYKQQGEDVHFLTGTAEHGSKIADSAEAAGESPKKFVDKNAAHFKKAWEVLNIKYDDFIRTTEKRHEKAVVKFFEKLKETGQLYEGEYEGLYCVGHEAFIKEGDLDEKGNCPDHGKPPEKIKEKNWFFKLSDYGDFLRKKIRSGEMEIMPAERRNEVLSLIDLGLEDIAISRRTAKFALPLPWDTEQTIYVWLDELFNYCSAIGYGDDEEKFKKYWPADTHLIGKDILKFHCVIWPALLDAIGEELPKKVFAHGFFTVDGQKISKSLGNAIDPVELVKEYGADTIRYYLLRDIPFGKDGDFSHERLKDRYNADLANGLGNLVSRTLNMIEQYIPDFDPAEPNKQLQEQLVNFGAGIEGNIENLIFDRALSDIWFFISRADELIEKTKPWELVKEGRTEEAEQILTGLFFTLEAINRELAPFLPDTHIKLTKLLEARPVKKPEEPLFARKD
jgi:methionyl-tRNA synthetase